jgi:hypothetical protein
MPDRNNSWSPIRWAKQVPPMVLRNGHIDKDAHHVLLVLATYAKPDGSEARPGLPTLARECYMSVAATADALDRIQAAGLIGKTADLNGGTVVWQLHLTVRSAGESVVDVRAERRREAARRRQQRHREQRRVTPQSDVTQPVDNPVDNPPVTPHSGVIGNAPQARDVTPHRPVTNAPLGRDVTPQWASQPQVTPATTAILELPLNCQTPSVPDRDAEFAAFWQAYPRRVAKAEARRKWDAAVNRGIDPAVILAGAERYATERAGADPRYTKHPTTWLNQGCWDDEPQPELGLLRVVGGYEPYRDPVDQSVYDERL